ncbi:MAG: 2'-5' RNA ligase family protein [Cyanobacteria bacterium P01_D01_bin.73]
MNQPNLSTPAKDEGGRWDEQPKLRRYFVAAIPTEAVQEQTNELKRELGRDYDCNPVWNSPPHVTVLPPFERSPDHISRLDHWLPEVIGTLPKFELEFKGLGAFPKHVLYVDVVQSPALMRLQSELDLAFEECEAPYEYSQRPDKRHNHSGFTPHMTLARCRAKRKGDKNPFDSIWAEICDRSFDATSPIENITLLEYIDRQWKVYAEYPLS